MKIAKRTQTGKSPSPRQPESLPPRRLPAKTKRTQMRLIFPACFQTVDAGEWRWQT